MPTGARPRPSARRRLPSPSSCGPGGCASCAGSAPGSRRGCASSSRPARSRSWPSSSAISPPPSSASAATSGSAPSARWRSRGRSESARPDELREAAAAGRLRTVPGIGPKTEARLLEALAREAEPRPQRGLLLNRAWELVGGIAAALGGEVGRRRSPLARLVRAAGRGLRRSGPVARAGALRRAAPDRRGGRAGRAAARSASRSTACPSSSSSSRRAPSGPPSCARPAPRLRRGARAAARGRPTRPPSIGRSGCRGARRSCARSRSAASRRTSSSSSRHPRRPALPHDVVGRPGERRGDGPRRPRARL